MVQSVEGIQSLFGNNGAAIVPIIPFVESLGPIWEPRELCMPRSSFDEEPALSEAVIPVEAHLILV